MRWSKCGLRDLWMTPFVTGIANKIRNVQMIWQLAIKIFKLGRMFHQEPDFKQDTIIVALIIRIQLIYFI